MPAGGWASALGAAILEGNKSYQQSLLAERMRQQQEFENKRQLEADKRAAELHTSTLATAKLQQQLAEDKVKNLGKSGALADVEAALKLSPDQAYNDPTFIANRATAGFPVQKQQPIPDEVYDWMGLRSVLPGTRKSLADSAGIAPDTGAVIPPEIIQAGKDREKKAALDDAMLAFLKGGVTPGSPRPNPGSSAGSSGGTTSTVDTPTGVPGIHRIPGYQEHDPEHAPEFFDPEEVRRWTMSKVTGIPLPEPKESDAHRIWAQRTALLDKSNFRAPTEKIQNELAAYSKARVLFPQLKEALMKQVLDKEDPTGQKAGFFAMAGQVLKQKIKKGVYDIGYPLPDTDALAQQLAGQLKVIGAGPYMTASRSIEMFKEVAVHLLDRGAAPEAQLQRLIELEKIFPDFEKEIGYRFQGGAGAKGPKQDNQFFTPPSSPKSEPPQASAVAPPQASSAEPPPTWDELQHLMHGQSSEDIATFADRVEKRTGQPIEGRPAKAGTPSPVTALPGSVDTLPPPPATYDRMGSDKPIGPVRTGTNHGRELSTLELLKSLKAAKEKLMRPDSFGKMDTTAVSEVQLLYALLAKKGWNQVQVNDALTKTLP